MTTTKKILIAAGGAAVTFALIFFACRILLASHIPRDFALIPFYLLLPVEVVGEVLASRAAALIAGFLEFFLLWWLALLAWARMQPRKRS